jgi:hypothetical protein
MAKPQIEGDSTKIPQTTGAWPLTSATSIHEARARLRNTGERAAVVFQSDRPVGVVTAAALASAHTSNGLVLTVMDHVTVPVNPRADAAETVSTFTHAAWHWLERRPAA